MLVFEERGKPEYPKKNLSEQGQEPTTNSAHTDTGTGSRTRATLVGGECSHQCAIPAPQNTLHHLLQYQPISSALPRVWFGVRSGELAKPHRA